MLKRNWILAFTMSWFVLLPTLKAQDGAIKPTEVITVFNGKNFDNLYTWLVNRHYEDPLRVFSVVDAIDGAPAIRISGEEWGAVITKNAYRDYRLVVELRWGSLTWGNRKAATRDSGILVHCQGPDGNTEKSMNGAWMRSIEAQVIEGGIGDFILVSGFDANGERITPSVKARAKQDRDGEWYYDPWSEPREFNGGRVNWYGRDPDWDDVLGFRGKQDVESPDGEWTRVEVICKGSSITNVVNGKVVNQISDSSLAQGKIIFQSEGAEIFIRKIELHPLD